MNHCIMTDRYMVADLQIMTGMYSAIIFDSDAFTDPYRSEVTSDYRSRPNIGIFSDLNIADNV
jgi:hypothetical protein